MAPKKFFFKFVNFGALLKLLTILLTILFLAYSLLAGDVFRLRGVEKWE